MATGPCSPPSAGHASPEAFSAYASRPPRRRSLRSGSSAWSTSAWLSSTHSVTHRRFSTKTLRRSKRSSERPSLMALPMSVRPAERHSGRTTSRGSPAALRSSRPLTIMSGKTSSKKTLVPLQNLPRHHQQRQQLKQLLLPQQCLWERYNRL